MHRVVDQKGGGRESENAFPRAFAHNMNTLAFSAYYGFSSPLLQHFYNCSRTGWMSAFLLLSGDYTRFPSGRQNFVKESLDNILHQCREHCFRAHMHLITPSLLSKSLDLSSTASGYTQSSSVSPVFLLFCLKSLRNSRH